MKAYILAKNEEENIDRCIKSLKGIAQISHICLLDSGSTDRTKEISEKHGATIIDYKYYDHCTAYNSITSEFNNNNETVIILDADMIVSSELINEISNYFKEGFEVIISPVKMYYEGNLLKNSSLYPPKPIAFKTGKEYFEPVGHGERLKKGFKIKKSKGVLIHDDKKAYDRFINSQLTYAKNFVYRSYTDKMTFRDKIRSKFPLGIIITPLYSYFVKLGFLDGKSGLLYALDRLIAEAIMYRYSLTKKEQKKININD